MAHVRRLSALILVLVPLALVATLAWADERQAARLAQGIRVGGVDVGGLTEDQAIARVWKRLRPQTMRPVRVRAAGRTFTLSANRAGVRLGLPAALRKARERSREGNFVERGWRAVTGARLEHEVQVRPVVSSEAVSRFVEGIERSVERPAVDAQLTMSLDGVSVSGARTGRALAEGDRLERRVARALRDPAASRGLRSAVVSTKPRIGRDDVWAATPVVVTVSRADRRARVFRRGEGVATYRVAVGEPGYPTPTGRFSVQVMQKDPVWNVPDSPWAGKLAGKTIPPGDPRNALVARWIGFDGAVGFHGTKSIESLGRAASRGCVRMSREDVISLFKQVTVGTPVLVGR